jgi:hypothetical protein
MKKRYLFITAALLSSMIYSCKKNAYQIIDKTVDPTTTAQIKFFNFGVNAPSMNFYASGTKISAVSSATGIESTTGTASGGVFPASNYSLISQGTYSFTGQLPSSLTTDANLTVLTTPGTLTNGNYYTLYACGLYNTTAKTSDAFIVQDKLPAIDYTVAYVRFVNTVPNAPNAFNFYVKNTTTAAETLVATSIAYKAASDFIAVPIGVYELYVRYPAAPTVNVISRNAAVTGTVSFVGGKVYTLGARGDITVTSTTATNRPQIDNTANR